LDENLSENQPESQNIAAYCPPGTTSDAETAGFVIAGNTEKLRKMLQINALGISAANPISDPKMYEQRQTLAQIRGA
jgi:hypothetical protein